MTPYTLGSMTLPLRPFFEAYPERAMSMWIRRQRSRLSGQVSGKTYLIPDEPAYLCPFRGLKGHKLKHLAFLHEVNERIRHARRMRERSAQLFPVWVGDVSKRC